jgi:site-specific DNA-cytosine methylase
MKHIVLSLLFIFCSLSPYFLSAEEVGDISKKKIILENINELQNAHQKSGFKEDNYEDLCIQGLFRFSAATIKKDMNDEGYKEDINKAIEYYKKAIMINSSV